MVLKIILFFNLLAYSVVVSQSFSYIIALRNVQQNMQPAAYIEFRRLLNQNFQVKYRIVLYASLFTCGALTILTFMDRGGLMFASSAIGLVALVADILLTVKGSVPVNRIINTWTAENFPANWKDYRSRWLSVFAKRQAASITGFLSLLLGAVFG